MTERERENERNVEKEAQTETESDRYRANKESVREKKRERERGGLDSCTTITSELRITTASVCCALLLFRPIRIHYHPVRSFFDLLRTSSECIVCSMYPNKSCTNVLLF